MSFSLHAQAQVFNGACLRPDLALVGQSRKAASEELGAWLVGPAIGDPGIARRDPSDTSSIEALRQQPGDDIKTGFSGSDHGDALSICDMAFEVVRGNARHARLHREPALMREGNARRKP